MLKIAICDDQRFFSTELKNSVENYFSQNREDVEISIYNDGVNLLKSLKEVKFLMEYDLGCVKIKLENTVKHKISIADGKIKTSKNDKKRHGYGLENVKNVAYKYHGLVDIYSENQRFIIQICLFP